VRKLRTTTSAEKRGWWIVTAKAVSQRSAVAHAFCEDVAAVLAAVRRLENPKGDPLGGGADCGDFGCETHFGVDTSLSSTAAYAH